MVLAMSMTNRNLLFCLMTGVVPAAFLAGPVHGQDARDEQQFWDAERRRHAAIAAVQMITQPNPYVMALVCHPGQGKVQHLARLPGYDPALGAPKLDPARLALVKDRTGMPDFRDRDPQIRGKYEKAAYDLYCTAVYFSWIAPVEAFEKSAEDNGEVTFGHLYQELNPRLDDKRELVNRYRGKVIPIQGQLLRLRQHPSPISLLDKGIPYVYEGWIMGPTPGAYPFCVIMPNPPEDKDSPTGVLEPAEQMNRSVKFYGYFFKLFHYLTPPNASDPLKPVPRDTPMLIGPA